MSRCVTPRSKIAGFLERGRRASRRRRTADSASSQGLTRAAVRPSPFAFCSQGIERGVRADPLPHSIRTANVRTPIRHLEMGPGDLLFFLGGTVAHGAYRWESPEPRRQALFSYSQQRERPFTW